jgi:hypothetical protein
MGDHLSGKGGPEPPVVLEEPTPQPRDTVPPETVVPNPLLRDPEQTVPRPLVKPQPVAPVMTDTEGDKQLLTERGRTLDQIKRLYAVVMGFALTTCITNAFLAARPINIRTAEELSIVIAPVIAFGSVMALFYLGVERLLDRKYLQPESGDPSWIELWIDLLSMGLTAVAFVVLANVFEAPASPASPHGLDDLRRFQDRFIVYLMGLYLLDVALLLIQLATLWARRSANRTNGRHLIRAHVIWLAINVISLALLYKLSGTPDRALPYLGLSVIASLLLVIHVVRFVADFKLTFEFYYPVREIRR